MEKVLNQWKRLSKELQAKDVKLRPVIEQLGAPDIRFNTDPYSALVEAILSQQLAPKASASIIKKFAELSPPFPTAELVLGWDKEKLGGAGVSPQKAGYLLALSKKWKDSKWRSGWKALPDVELTARLTEVKGIGVWTAHMFLIFSLGRPDILPVGDYGIRRGVQLLFKKKNMTVPREMPALVPHWKGMASIASWYIWKALDQKILK